MINRGVYIINTLGILSLIAAIFYLWLGFFGFYLYSRGRLNRLFLGISLCLAVWSFGYGFFYSAPDEASAWFWFRLSSPGWVLLPAFLLLFGLEVAGRLKYMKNYAVLFVFMWPALELYKALTGVLTAEGFKQEIWGNVEIISFANQWHWLHVAYYITYVGIMFFFICRWGKKSPLRREKMQSLLIIIFGFFILISGMITNLILPALNGSSPGVAHFFGVIWAAGFLYAVARYRFMRFDYSQILENVLAHVNDMVLILGYDFRLLKINQKAEKLLGIDASRIKELYFWDLVENGEGLRKNLQKIKKQSYLYMPVVFKTGGRRKIITRTFCTAIKDDFGDIIVITVVSQDIRLISRLRQEVKMRRNKEKELKYLSMHDPLTGLYNRAYFMELMRDIEENKKVKIGLIVCDLDGLKEINDRFGHLMGDEFIKKAAEVLKSCVRSQDKVMRIGGDEFAAVLMDIDEGMLKETTARIKEAFSCMNLAIGEACVPGISAGYAYREDVSTTVDELFRLADSRMYEDKYSNRNKGEQIC